MDSFEIKPGVGVGDILLGTNCSFLKEQGFSRRRMRGYDIYEQRNIAIICRDNLIDEIVLLNDFPGKLVKNIGLGNTLRELENVYGRLYEDDEDALVLENVPGICFETEKWTGEPGDEKVQDNLDTKITEIYIYLEKDHIS